MCQDTFYEPTGILKLLRWLLALQVMHQAMIVMIFFFFHDKFKKCWYELAIHIIKCIVSSNSTSLSAILLLWASCF